MLCQNMSSATWGPPPEDEGPGKMKLYWPSTELYDIAHKLSLKEKSAAVATHQHTKMYPTTLSERELRQACLTPVADDTAPVHVALEVYEEDLCPEYEAVSYTWREEAEESDASGAYYPVYLGQSWDIVLQSRNCWNLLHFLRRSDHVRRVWVDAICINQHDTLEKSRQVTKMDRIYERSSRVVVYLGSSTVVKRSDECVQRYRLSDYAKSSHPTISPELPDGSKPSFYEILRNRYFSRIWVIQELVRAPSAVIRIGEIDVIVDPNTMDRIKGISDWNWKGSAAEWVQYASRQSNFEGDLCEALEIVSQCECSDPRDRLFGIMGLIDPNFTIQHGLRVDYSLSSKHLWVGFFAHCLLTLKITWFLAHAAGIAALNKAPTWVPDWSVAETWRSFQRNGPTEQSVADAIRAALRAEKSSPLDLFYFDIPPARPRRMGAPFKEEQQPRVEASTGVLQHLTVLHLFEIPSVPKFVVKVSNYSVFSIKMLDGSTCFVTSGRPLDDVVRPGHDHLFVLLAGGEPTFAILRDLEGPLRRLSFLHGPEVYLYNDRARFGMVSGLSAVLGSGQIGREDQIEMSLRSVPIDRLPRTYNILSFIHEFKWTLRRFTKPAKQQWGLTTYPGSWEVRFPEEKESVALHSIFALGATEIPYLSLIPLLWMLASAIIDPRPITDKKLQKAITSSIKRYRPSVEGNYLIYTASRQWDSLPKCESMEWEWKVDAGWASWKSVKKGNPCHKGVLEMTIPNQRKEQLCVRTPILPVLDIVRTAKVLQDLARPVAWFRQVFDITNSEKLSDYLSEPCEEWEDIKVELNLPEFSVTMKSQMIDLV